MLMRKLPVEIQAFEVNNIPLMAELPKPDEPISSDSIIGSEAADIIEEQLPPLPVDSMMEAFEKNKQIMVLWVGNNNKFIVITKAERILRRSIVQRFA
jgi:hypothetical protein